MRIKKTVAVNGTFEVAEASTNELVTEAIEGIINEAVSHFSKIKRSVRDPEEDARYFWNDTELNLFLKKVAYPDKVWVSTVYDDSGKFYAYRVGRICVTKKGEHRV